MLRPPHAGKLLGLGDVVACHTVDDVVSGLYANRFYPVTLGTDALADYWNLRRGVVLYDIPEKPLSIMGPDSVELLERVFTRPISDLVKWRARYAIACAPDGGILMDGVLIRLAKYTTSRMIGPPSRSAMTNSGSGPSR